MSVADVIPHFMIMLIPVSTVQSNAIITQYFRPHFWHSNFLKNALKSIKKWLEKIKSAQKCIRSKLKVRSKVFNSVKKGFKIQKGTFSGKRLRYNGLRYNGIWLYISTFLLFFWKFNP